MRVQRRSLVGALLAPAILSGAPVLAGFNDIVQIFCDVDLATAGSCDATADGMKFVSSVAVSPDDHHVYVCSSQADTVLPQKESLSAFSRAADGSLTLVDQEVEDSGGVSTLESCRGVAVSPDGNHVYTAALTDSAVTWFSRNPTTGALTFTAGDSVSDVEQGSELSGAHAVAVSPDNQHVYVAAATGDAVAAFSRNTTSGDLTWIDNYIDDVEGVTGLDGVEDIAVSPDGKHVYVASPNDNAVTVFSRDDSSSSANFGELTFVESKFDGVGGVDGIERAGEVALDPDGDNVYVASENLSFSAEDWFAAFSRNATSGALTFLQSFRTSALSSPIGCGGLAPTDTAISVSPDGLFVAVSSPAQSAIATFSRAADGTLSLVESICDDIFVVGSDDIGAVADLAHSPDGDNLYSAGGAFETLATIDSDCDSANVDLALSNESVSTTKSETACRSITMGPDYDVLAAGDLLAVSPVIALGNDVSFDGEVTLANAVP